MSARRVRQIQGLSQRQRHLEWRVFWKQQVGRTEWFIGYEYECRLMFKTAQAAGERCWLVDPQGVREEFVPQKKETESEFKGELV